MKTKKWKVHKIDTESELEISDNKESDSSSSERGVKYIHKKKNLHKRRKVKKVPSSEDSTGTSDSETDSDSTPLRKTQKYKKKVHKHRQKEKEPPTVNLADLNQLPTGSSSWIKLKCVSGFVTVNNHDTVCAVSKMLYFY